MERTDDGAGMTAGVRRLVVTRRYTRAGEDQYERVAWDTRDSVIANPDGTVVAATRGAEIPKSWSQLATDIVVSKYFRRAGLHGDAAVGERSVRQVVFRIAHTLREVGEAGGYFADVAEADAFEDELTFLLLNQYGAFNSPVWFNVGLAQRYAIRSQGGNWRYDEALGRAVETEDAYTNPQGSACFIQGVEDDLMSIFELVKNEARLFKYGSGTGTNFSALRGHQEKLSGGGTSSGMMSFMEVFDRAAGSTKSGGTTRRAAKMACLDMDHPEIVDFIEWKMKEEKKAQALIAAGYPSDFNGEAYRTVSGQNSNNSVRVTDEFMRCVEQDGEWKTIARTTGKVVETLRAKDLWHKVALSAWACADPGVQYDTTINDWHTCKVSGRINASNPCSEFMFLDDTSCNLASLNLTKFLVGNPGAERFDIEGYRHAARVFFLAQEILVGFSSYPTKQIAQNSHDFRPLGLGYANLGTLLMFLGVGYDSDRGRAIAAALTAVLTGHAYRVSAEIAAVKGPFAAFEANRESMLAVMAKHEAAVGAIDPRACPADLLSAAAEDWREAVRLGELHGYRNAQATVLAPTGTIGLLMDCDTTGIEPDFALVKFKKLAGGGQMKIVNDSVGRALSLLGYTDRQVADILVYVSGTLSLRNASHCTLPYLVERGFTPTDIERVERLLSSVFTIEDAFGAQALDADAAERLGVSGKWREPGFSLLTHWGLSRAQIHELEDHAMGRATVEGAPHLREEHLVVFDCASRCGRNGRRYLAPVAHVKMMAATQPFLSGAISKTVNLPNDATVEEVAELYYQGWKLGLKAVALYRDGCKASQPLNSGAASATSPAAKALEAVVALTEPSSATAFLADPAARMHFVNTTAREALGQPVRATDEYTVPVNAIRAASPTSGRAVRRRLPKRRYGFVQEVTIDGHKMLVRVSKYEDGQLGEIFFDMHKEGASFRALLNAFAVSVSIGLQYGIPPSEYVERFSFVRFEPQGLVQGDPSIRVATSIVDYMARLIGVEFCGRTDLAHVQSEPEVAPLLGAADAPPQAVQDAVQARLNVTRNGDACTLCGGMTYPAGACRVCHTCGKSSGCS